MIEVMENKKSWNLRVFESVAKSFDDRVDRSHRGDKGVSATAAVLMFLVADDQTRQRYVDVVKLAEGRGLDGSVLDAARKIIDSSEAPAPPGPAQAKAAVDRVRSRRKGSGRNKSSA